MLLTGCFLLIAIGSVSGNNIDSLRTVYAQGDDSAKFEALSGIVNYYRNVDIDSAKFYLKELYIKKQVIIESGVYFENKEDD